jgi:nucleolar protein 4
MPSLPGFISVSTPAVRTKPVQPRGQPVKKSTDSNAIRTLVLSGIPADVDKSTLWKRVRKVDGIDGGVQEGLKYPVEIEVGEGEEVKETLGKTAHIIFTSHGKATDAIPKLHAHTYKGVLLSCVLKKRIESIPGAGGDTSGKANRAGRLIIRNLAWNTTESDLRSLFLPYGPILGINLPTSASKLPHKDPSKPAPPPRARGFAFVWFLSKKDAEKAIEELNEKEVKERKISVDWAVAKDKYEEKKKEDGDVDDKAAVEAVLATEGDETVKEQEEGVEAQAEAEGDDEDEDEDEDEKMEVEEEEIKPVKPVLPAVEEGSTLFIRNLPFETTEEELRNL